VKIADLHSRNAWEYHAELHEELDYHALPYQTVAQGVQAFKDATVSTMTCIPVDI
jgi:hypothetical protein